MKTKSNGINEALTYQVGGNHYKSMAIQPIEFCYHNMNLNEFIAVCQKDILKYAFRKKGDLHNRIEDFKKVQHCAEFAIKKLEETLLNNEQTTNERGE